MVAAKIASVTTPSATGFPGSSRSPQYEQSDRNNAYDENDVVHLAELPEQQPSPIKKIVPPACHAKKARQLRHGDGQAGASLEAHKNTVADQLHERAQSQQPSEHAKRRHCESCEACNLRVTLSVALGHRTHCSGNHERDSGSWPDCELS